MDTVGQCKRIRFVALRQQIMLTTPFKGQIDFYDLQSRSIFTTIQSKVGVEITAEYVNKKQTMIFVGLGNGEVHQYDIMELSLVAEFRMHPQRKSSPVVVITETCNGIYVGHQDGTIRAIMT